MTARQPGVPPTPLDAIDLKILRELQTNARSSIAALAKSVALTATPCARRVQQLEQAGYIKGYVTLLDQSLLGLPVMAAAFVLATPRAQAQDDDARTDPPARVGAVTAIQGEVQLAAEPGAAWDRAQINWPVSTGACRWWPSTMVSFSACKFVSSIASSSLRWATPGRPGGGNDRHLRRVDPDSSKEADH